MGNSGLTDVPQTLLRVKNWMQTLEHPAGTPHATEFSQWTETSEKSL